MIKYILGASFLLICVSPIFAGNLESREEREAKIDKFAHDAPFFIQGKSLKDIKKIGKLKRESYEKKQNLFDEKKIDTFISMQFDGLKIYGYLKSKDELWPILISITKPKWKILKGLNVGTPVFRTDQVLGPPGKYEQHIKEYCGETECVNFTEDNGTITKIEFQYYVD